MRILVVDDDEDVRRLTRLALTRGGYEVAEAAGGEEAARFSWEVGPHLVLCDLFMPGKDGLEVIRRLRRESPELKIIAMSGGGLDGTADLLPVARAVGADGVLYKPFGVADLLDAVRQALAS